MRRWSTLLLLLLLGQCLSGSTPGAPSPVAARRISIASALVPLDSNDPLRRKLGRLTYLAGWHLTSDARSFGGLSALDIDGNRVTAISDTGAVVRFRIGQFGHVSGASIAPMPAGCGPVTLKEDNDTESVTHDPTRSTWWIGMEFRNRICRTNGDFTAARHRDPPEMADWHKKRGPETLMRLNDGRFLTIAEEYPDRHPVSRAVLFDRDPTDPAARTQLLGYRPPDGYSPTDGLQLADGRILILNRRFAIPSLFTAKLVLIDAPQLKAGAVLHGEEIADFESPVIADNFEGLAAATENGRTILWITSDDNFMRWQRTLLLKFALD